MICLHTFVPKCPKCNSNRTGYFIYGEYQNETILFKHLLKGEYVYQKTFLNDANNCFCLDCGTEWEGILKVKILSQKNIEIEKSKKGITDKYIKETKKIFEKIKEQNAKESNKKSITNKLYTIIKNIL